MYLWYYSTRAFARNSFHANRPEIHGARQICIQSYNINNVFLHFIISRRIHATFCTMVVFIPAALYSETSGLQPIKYAVRPGILQFPGLTAYFLLPVPKSHGFIPLFLSYQAVLGSHAAIFPLQTRASLLQAFSQTFSAIKNMPRHIFAPSAVACGMSLLRASVHPARRAKSTLSSVFLYRNIPHPDIFFIM